MNSALNIILVIFLCFLLGGLSGVITGFYTKRLLVEKGYGLYCSDTGNFAFKGECNNE